MPNHEVEGDDDLADRLTQVSHLNAEQALSVVQRIEADDAERRCALLTHLQRREVGQESKLLFVKDGPRIEARLCPAEDRVSAQSDRFSSLWTRGPASADLRALAAGPGWDAPLTGIHP